MTTMSPQAKFLEALQSATESEGGEVIATSNGRSGRVYVVRNQIAWATTTCMKGSIVKHLEEHGLATSQDIKDVIETCRTTGANFIETVIEWKLVAPEAMRRELLAFITDRIVEIFLWEDFQTMFVPSTRTFKGNALFDISEIVATTNHKLGELDKKLDPAVLALYSENIPSEAVEQKPSSPEAIRFDEDLEGIVLSTLLEAEPVQRKLTSRKALRKHHIALEILGELIN
ncbi:hypothetical protein KAI87_16750, partial [Myxococcota bacterium]|nr:hypothetical protein [Myxococcota bacterium]